MSRRYKIFIPNNIYFIIFTVLGWKHLFTNEEYYNLIYKWFDYIKEKYGNLVHGYVIMPNHIHCLMYITDKSPRISILIMNAKRFLAYALADYLRRDRGYELLSFFAQNARINDRAHHHFFTDRYDSLIIQSQKLFLEKLNYIHHNPVQGKWFLADRAKDYKHSSASNYILGHGLYNVDVIDF